jgi:hypothetical protein
MPKNSGGLPKKRAHSPSSGFRSEAPDSPSSTSSPEARAKAIAALKRGKPAPQALEDEFESSSSSGDDSELEVTSEKMLLCLNNAYDHFQNDWELRNAYVWIPDFIFESKELESSRKSTPDQQDGGGSNTSDMASLSTTPTSHADSPPGWTPPFSCPGSPQVKMKKHSHVHAQYQKNGGGSNTSDIAASLCTTSMAHADSPPGWTTPFSCPGSSPELKMKKLSYVHTQYRKNCITPLIEWTTKKYKLCLKGCTNPTKQREFVEQILRLVHMSYESNNPDRLWKIPTVSLSACAFFNIRC